MLTKIQINKSIAQYEDGLGNVVATLHYHGDGISGMVRLSCGVSHIISGMGHDTDSPENIQRMIHEVEHNCVIPHGKTLKDKMTKAEYLAQRKSKV